MKADTVTKDFIKDTAVFADIFNYYIYDGQPVIQPEQLTERDSVKIALPYGLDGKTVPVQRFRDVQKMYTAMTDGKAEYVLCGVENQAKIHYAMPVRDNLYDALDYTSQVEEIARSHREAMRKAREERRTRRENEIGETAAVEEAAVAAEETAVTAEKTVVAAEKAVVVAEKMTIVSEKTAVTTEKTTITAGEPAVISEEPGGNRTGAEPGRRLSSGEFLGGFWKEDRLIPSITVTIYFGSDEWDGPLNLFDMMEVTDPRLFDFMDNYHVRLIAPARMSDEEIMKFQTNLREVLLFIKYSKDKEKLKEILESNKERFQEVERRAAEVIEVITNTELKHDEKEEKVDVCQAIVEMREEERLEGVKNGKLEKARDVSGNLYRKGMGVEEIAGIVGYDVKMVKGWLGLSPK